MSETAASSAAAPGPRAGAAPWALVLGVSSGFGAAAARALAAAGYDICGVHLDRRATLPAADAVAADVRAAGRRAVFHNVNAADAEARATVIAALAAEVEPDHAPLRVVLHSLAFGTLRPFLGDGGATPKQLDMTLDVMAHSLVYWTQGLHGAGLVGRGARIFAMTSIGSERVWPGYGPVSAAKAALESHVRQLAFELAPSGVSVNALMAGVTDTPALRKIPGHELMLDAVRARHPAGRITTPEDVASAIVELARPGTTWLTGNVLRIDGGESLAG